MHDARLTGGPTKPCQSQIIRLGLNTIPNEMAIFYTLPSESIHESPPPLIMVESEGYQWARLL